MSKDSANQPIDISLLIDNGPFTFYQRIIVCIVAFAIILDGFDSQAMGYAIPILMDDWGLMREAFIPAVTASFIGMVIGSIICGILADRLGRKRLLMITLFICGGGTFLVGFSTDVTLVASFRFISGIGLGGALPICTTMVAEFTPARHRTLMVTAAIVCVPLGGMIAGVVSSFIFPHFGWRALFFIGGVLPIILVFIIRFTLPETPRFLARDKKNWHDLRQLLLKLSRPVSSTAAFLEEVETTKEAGGYKILFSKAMRRDTIAIWIAFFFCLIAGYSAFGWLPTMLKAEHIDLSSATLGLTVYNLGGVVGALSCAYIISYYGSRWPMIFCATGGFLSIFAMLFFDIADHIPWMIVLMLLHGLFVNAVQSTLYALCAYMYPTRMRARGASGAAAFGRLGAILSGLIGAPIITHNGSTGFILLLGISMVVVTITLAFIKNHIPSVKNMAGKTKIIGNIKN